VSLKEDETMNQKQEVKTWRVQRKSDLRYNYFFTKEEMQLFTKRQRSEWGERFSRVQSLEPKSNHWRNYYYSRDTGGKS